MSYYINKIKSGWSISDLEKELKKLILEYTKERNQNLFIYSSAIGKPIPAIQIDQGDFYIIRDLLNNQKQYKKVDFYIETPGGSGETAEEIVRFLRTHFESIAFLVSGEAKSAGTIIVLSGDEILMTETGSLGPIDAQMRIGRSVVSAYDYIEWVNDKRNEAEKLGRLNPFDATMVAQITPGELGSVYHALKFAEDLVVDWLTKYKFKHWNHTETSGKKVTASMKKNRAEKIARKLTNHSKWRSHGRSIKMDDLVDIGLKIVRVDDNTQLADIVYRIQTVIRLIFENTSVYKIFATKDNIILKQAIPAESQIRMPKRKIPDVVKVEQKCPSCDYIHNIFAKLVNDPKIDNDLKKMGSIPFPKDAKIKCKCGFEIDLLGIKNQIEIQTGRKIVY